MIVSNSELASWAWLQYWEDTNDCMNCNNPKWRVFFDETIQTESSVKWEDDYYICRKCLLKQYKNYNNWCNW